MGRPYTVAAGARFVLPDGSMVGEGERIELEDDVAAVHAGKVAPEPMQTSAPAGDDESKAG